MKAPTTFTVRNVGKTLVTRTSGTKVRSAGRSAAGVAQEPPRAPEGRYTRPRGWAAAHASPLGFGRADCVGGAEGPRVRGVAGRPAEGAAPIGVWAA